MSAVVVVGAGPAGTCVVERICANARRFGQGHLVDLHVVDPYPPGAGRLWRRGVARADSPAGDLAVFPGETPSSAEWLGRAPGYFPTRSEVGGYLTYVFNRAVRDAPGDVRVRVHQDRAVSLTESAGTQRVELATGGTLEADVVVLAQGHPDVPPSPEDTVFAARHGLLHLTGGPALDADPDVVPPGEPVLVRGMGRALADLLAPLTTGRGGRFAEGRRGELVYLPGGDEPLLHVGSRRGVPHHARPGYRLADTPPARRFPCERQGVTKELAHAYYRELFTRHPSRTRTTWEEFEPAFVRAEWGGKELRALVTASVPRFADRLHLDRLERPLHGIRFGDPAGLQRWTHGYLAADLERRADPAFSADLALSHALLAARTGLAGDPWLQGMVALLADGPSLARQAELRALARAGIVTFLGAEPRIERDDGGLWRATSPTVPGATTARTLIEARPPGARSSADPLIAGLYARGECREVSGLLDVRLPDRRLVDPDGVAHERRFALGSWTVGGLTGFDGPGGAQPLARQADALARTVLAQVTGSWLHAAA
ncbi:FAD/NAD(P)-binding protein [Nonomuraea sp. NPDC046802]|uniref:FAD/NAD(P)-binding protein n=1 Tax=Nonomuraea sp. NPDC046802 TaxID=3154919 RepID=UPI0033C388BF